MPSESFLIVEQIAAPFAELPDLLRELGSTHHLDSYGCRQRLLGSGQALLAKGNEEELAAIRRLLDDYEIESYLFAPSQPSFAPFALTRFETSADKLLLFGREKELRIPRGARLLILLADLSGHLIERNLNQFLSSQRYRGTNEHRRLPGARQQHFILQGRPVVDIYLLGEDGPPVAAARALPGRFDHRCLGERATLSAAQNLLKLIELVEGYAGECRVDMDFGLSPLPGACLKKAEQGDLDALRQNLRNLTRYAWLQADIDRQRKQTGTEQATELGILSAALSGGANPELAARLPELEQVATAIAQQAGEKVPQRRRTPLKDVADLPPPPEIQRHNPWTDPKTLVTSAFGLFIVLLIQVDQFGRWLMPLLKTAFASGGITALLAAGLFFAAFRRLKLKRLIENTPTSKIRSVAMGMVEIKGTARRQYALVAPMSTVACVYYRLTRYRRDSKDNWVVSSITSSGQIPFWVEDETGRVSVNPERAAVNTAHRQESCNGLSATLGGFTDSDEKWTEELIYDGALVYVLGEAQVKKDARPQRAERRATALRRLKQDPQRLTEYDINGDGRIDAQEWQAACDAVDEELLHQDLAASGTRRRQEDQVVIGRPRQRGLPFVVAETHSEAHLTATQSWSSALMLVGALLATALSAWLLTH